MTLYHLGHMKILIFEDNETELNNLLQCISVFFKAKDIEYTIKLSNDEKDILDHTFEYDLIFLDVEVNNINGIELGIKIREINEDVKIIFVTNFTKYLIDGYKAHADRYFLKPIKQSEFNIELNSVLKNYIEKHSGFFDEKVSPYKIYYKDILYVEFYNRKSIIHFKSGKNSETNYPLKYWLSKLECHGFSQPYKSCIVNLSEISGFHKESVIMSNEDIIPISRYYKKTFENSYISSLHARL